jgi:HEAT repeat protein
MRGVTMALGAGAVVVLLAAAIYLRSSGEAPVPPPTSHAQPQNPAHPLERSARVEERLGQLRDDYDHRQGAAAALPEPNKRAVPTLPAGKKLAAQQKTDGDDDDDDDPEEIESLKNTLFTNPDPDERIGAVLMLSGDDGPESLRLLEEAMTDSDPEVRLAVVEALGDRSDDLTPDTLTPAMADPDAEVRFEAVSILGDMETPDAMQMVRTALNDRDEDVRSLAEGIVDMADDEPGAPQQAAPPAPTPHG